MQINMIIENQSVVNEFLKDYKSSYDKYFEGKQYLIKDGDYWSVVVGYCVPSFPPSKVVKPCCHHLSVSLYVWLLFAHHQKQKIDTKYVVNNRGELLIVHSWLKDAIRNSTVKGKVLSDILAFINDIFKMSHPEYDLNMSPSLLLKSFDKYRVKTCEICGKEFYGLAKSKYCSNACRCKAKRQKSHSK